MSESEKDERVYAFRFSDLRGLFKASEVSSCWVHSFPTRAGEYQRNISVTHYGDAGSEMFRFEEQINGMRRRSVEIPAFAVFDLYDDLRKVMNRLANEEKLT